MEWTSKSQEKIIFFFWGGKYESMNQLLGVLLYLIESFSTVSIKGGFFSDVISESPMSLCQVRP